MSEVGLRSDPSCFADVVVDRHVLGLGGQQTKDVCQGNRAVAPGLGLSTRTSQHWLSPESELWLWP